MITCLCGGVGGARFLEGLMRVVKEEVTVIVNTGDDLEVYGLHVSPDIDIVIYTLAGMVDKEKGWGMREDTFHCLGMLQRYGYEPWFMLGDRDLATHIYRTLLLRGGFKLSEVTDLERKALGVKAKILPMSDDRVETIVVTDQGAMHFQEYLVKRKAKDKVQGVRFKGAEEAQPAPNVIESISEARGVIVCPSNPIVSIGTILSPRGVRKALMETNAKVVGISPIIAGAPVKGPADKLMSGLRMEVSAFTVAMLYNDFLNAFIIDVRDEALKEKIEALGMKVITTNTLMKGMEEKESLARTALEAIGE